MSVYYYASHHEYSRANSYPGALCPRGGPIPDPVLTSPVPKKARDRDRSKKAPTKQQQLCQGWHQSKKLPLELVLVQFDTHQALDPRALDCPICATFARQRPSPWTRRGAGTQHPPPYTPHPTPYTLHPTPYTLHPTLHPAQHTLHIHPTPYTIHHTPYPHRGQAEVRRGTCRHRRHSGPCSTP